MISVPIDNIVSVDEAKDKLKELVDQVSGDTFFVLTKNNKPVSVMISVEHLKKLLGQPASASNNKSEPVKPEPYKPSAPAFNTNFKPVEPMIKPKTDLPPVPSQSLPPITPPPVTPAIKPFTPSSVPPMPAKVSIPVPPITPPKPTVPTPAPTPAMPSSKPFTPASGGGNPLGITNNNTTIETEEKSSTTDKDNQASPAQFTGETPLPSTPTPSPTPSTNGVRLLDLNQSAPTASPTATPVTTPTSTPPVVAVPPVSPPAPTTTPAVTATITPDTKKDADTTPKDIEIG